MNRCSDTPLPAYTSLLHLPMLLFFFSEAGHGTRGCTQAKCALRATPSSLSDLNHQDPSLSVHSPMVLLDAITQGSRLSLYGTYMLQIELILSQVTLSCRLWLVGGLFLGRALNHPGTG